MSQGRLIFLAMLPVAALLSGCDSIEAKPDPPFVFEVSAVSDPGKGVEGVELTLPSGKVAKTDAKGKVKLKLRGHVGDVVSITAKCPARYNLVGEPLSVTLYHLASGKKAPNYEVQCSPTHREVVAAIRAPKGAGIPVTRFGKTVARTDESGAAHIAVEGRPGEQVDFVLDTSQGNAEWLRPRSPTVTFVIPPNDDIVLLEQAFSVERPPVVKVAAPRSKPDLRPTKI